MVHIGVRFVLTRSCSTSGCGEASPPHPGTSVAFGFDTKFDFEERFGGLEAKFSLIFGVILIR